MSKYAAAQLMMRKGGDFLSAVACAWNLADEANRKKIEEAFADEFAQYEALFEEKYSAYAQGYHA